MRATSLPTAPLVATAALVLVAAVLALSAVPSTALAERWLRPVPGEVARPFSYARAVPFVRGAHRGADLAAAPGTAVRAACSGRVVHAGAVAGPEQVVSVRCRARRVSYLPLAAVAVRAGALVRAGERLGRVARGHGGLHVGVRREGDPFGYEDPMPLLADAERPLTPVRRPPGPRPAVRRTVPRRVPRRTAPRLAPLPARPRLAPRSAPPRLAPRSAPPRLAPRSAPPRLAPWPAWVGLGVLLAGAAGSGTVAVRRRRTAHARAGLAAAQR